MPKPTIYTKENITAELLDDDKVKVAGFDVDGILRGVSRVSQPYGRSDAHPHLIQLPLPPHFTVALCKSLNPLLI